jgi:putative ABC transport system substrate-binding protein
MGRRALALAVALALFAAQAHPEAQESGARVRRIGVLMSGNATDRDQQANVAAFARALEKAGWATGQNLVIDVRWGAADPARMQRYAGELVGLAPDALLAMGAAVPALQRESRTIPTVFVVLHDPVERGIVSSLARPGGNITGFTDYDSSMGGKWVEFLREAAPRVARILVLKPATTGPYPSFRLFWPSIEDAARRLVLMATSDPVRGDADIERAIAAFARKPDAGLIIMSDAFTTLHRKQIIESAARHRVPAVYPFGVFAASGGLMSYGVDFIEQFEQAASYVDRILRGAKPADLPVQRPTRFELVINLKTAKALGLTILPSLLLRADHVIE